MSNLPDSFEAELREIERRLRTLEITPRLPNISTLLGMDGATVSGTGTRLSTTYGDLSDVVGPSLTVNVRGRGGLIVLQGAWFNGFETTGYTSFALSGANTLAAADSRAVQHQLGLNSAWVTPLSGLNPGETTITLKYKTDPLPASAGEWKDRWVVAIPF